MDEAMHSSVGAGDAFLAAATLALARGATPADALAWGTAAGATAIACAGTARLRRADVAEAVPDIDRGEGAGVRPQSASALRLAASAA